MICSIVAHDKNGLIGIDNKIPWHEPSERTLLAETVRRDLQLFRELTKDQLIIMGRLTYDSIGHALPHRVNIVVSKTIKWLPDAKVVGSLRDALNFSRDRDAFVIGGASIYKEAMPFVDLIYRTVIDHEYEVKRFHKPVYFPTLLASEWTISTYERTHHAIFQKLIRRSFALDQSRYAI